MRPASPSHHSAIAVISDSRVQDIIEEAGVGSWALAPDKARRQKYVVCCREKLRSERRSDRDRFHAFLVGRIRAVQPAGAAEERKAPRVRLALSEYAEVDEVMPWTEWRNPVKYTALEAIGIYPVKLKFHHIAEPTANPDLRPKVRKLTVTEAKEGLAAALGVEPDLIELTVRTLAARKPTAD